MLDSSIKAYFGGDESQLNATLGKAQSSVASFAEKAKGLMAGLGAAVGIGSLGVVASNAMKMGAELAHSSTAIGINVEALQVLRAKARDLGVDQQALEQSIFRTGIAAVQASQGVSSYKRAFDVLGISTSDFLRLPQEQRLAAVGRAMATATDKNAAYNAVAQIFGTRMGPQMMNILHDLATEGFPKMAAEAKKAGDVMSAETVAALEKADTAIARFKDRITMGVGNIIVNFRTKEGMELLLYRFLEVAGRFGGKIVDAISGLNDLVGSALKATFLKVALTFKNGLIEGVEAVAKVVNHILPKKLEINIANLEQMKSDVGSLGDEFSKQMAKTTQTNFSEQFGGFWKKLGDQQQNVVDQINRIDLGKQAGELRNAGRQLYQNTADGAAELASAGREAGKKIKEAADPVIRAVGMAGIRTNANQDFAQASDKELAELARRDKEHARQVIFQSTFRPFGRSIADDLEAARANIEAGNAEAELKRRGQLRQSVKLLGMEGARRQWGGDPLLFDRLVEQYGKGLDKSDQMLIEQRKTNTILNGLFRNQ